MGKFVKLKVSYTNNTLESVSLIAIFICKNFLNLKQSFFLDKNFVNPQKLIAAGFVHFKLLFSKIIINCKQII